MVLTTMVDFSASRAARASAARVVALMAAGGEWPAGWGGLVPSLLGQLALAAATVSQARAGGGVAPGGEGQEAGGEGVGADAAAVVAGGGPAAAGGGTPAAAAAAAVPAPEHVEHAVAKAESCAKCLQYMTEEVCLCVCARGSRVSKRGVRGEGMLACIIGRDRMEPTKFEAPREKGRSARKTYHMNRSSEGADRKGGSESSPAMICAPAAHHKFR